jgi:hypothetical protein
MPVGAVLEILRLINRIAEPVRTYTYDVVGNMMVLANPLAANTASAITGST